MCWLQTRGRGHRSRTHWWSVNTWEEIMFCRLRWTRERARGGRPLGCAARPGIPAGAPRSRLSSAPSPPHPPDPSQSYLQFFFFFPLLSCNIFFQIGKWSVRRALPQAALRLRFRRLGVQARMLGLRRCKPGGWGGGPPPGALAWPLRRGRPRSARDPRPAPPGGARGRSARGPPASPRVQVHPRLGARGSESGFSQLGRVSGVPRAPLRPGPPSVTLPAALGRRPGAQTEAHAPDGPRIALLLLPSPEPRPGRPPSPTRRLRLEKKSDFLPTRLRVEPGRGRNWLGHAAALLQSAWRCRREAAPRRASLPSPRKPRAGWQRGRELREVLVSPRERRRWPRPRKDGCLLAAIIHGPRLVCSSKMMQTLPSGEAILTVNYLEVSEIGNKWAVTPSVVSFLLGDVSGFKLHLSISYLLLERKCL